MRKKVTLFADKGMVITDGENFGTTVDVEINGDESKYYEITQEEYNEMQKKRDAEHTEVISGEGDNNDEIM